MNRTRTLLTAVVALVAAAAAGWAIVAARLGVGPAIEGLTEVQLLRNDLSPEHLLVPQGTTVTWHWDGIEHDLVGDGWSVPARRHGTWSRTFTQPGTHQYRCTLHEPMRGAVTVHQGGGRVPTRA